MISGPVPSWQTVLAEAYRDAARLAQTLQLPADRQGAPGVNGFPLLVPKPFVARMKRGDMNDPLLRQVLPDSREQQPAPGFGMDPVGDGPAMKIPGVIHKYRGRVLLITTGACALHCRYCFRRHFAYQQAHSARNNWRDALAYIRDDDSIREVILSGGDPLSMTDEKLSQLCARLGDIPHVKRLRIHTRFPIAVPERVDVALLTWLAELRVGAVIVIQANHANEIDRSVAAALNRLAQAGSVLLNQSVLLRGINDDASALAGLSEALFEAGVLPYYLHLLDRAEGAAHFEVDEGQAKRLMDALRARLPGYLVPRLVRERPGSAFKIPIC